MSFIHFTLVGHFDPCDLSSKAVARPIDPAVVEALLAEYPEEVRAHVTLERGYVRCQWAPIPSASEEVIELAYRLARQEACLAVENGRTVEYPPEAVRAQAELWERMGAPAGVAESREAQARKHAKAFDLRLRERAGGGQRRR